MLKTVSKTILSPNRWATNQARHFETQIGTFRRLSKYMMVTSVVGKMIESKAADEWNETLNWSIG